MREAGSAGEAVDCHDLRASIESHNEWVLLHQEQAAAVKQLTDYVTAHCESLLYAARESVVDSLALLAKQGGDPLMFLQGLVKRNEPVLRPRPTNPDGALVAVTPESIRLKVELARRSVALARSVQLHAAIGVLIVHLTHGERLVLPIEHLQGLVEAVPEQLEKYELLCGGLKIYFPDVNTGFWVPALARGVYGTSRWMNDLRTRLNSPLG